MNGSSVEQQAIQQATAELVADSLVRVLLDIEAYEEHLPCVLICTDLKTREQTFSGPFPTRTLGERILQHEVASDGLNSTLAFSLAPLYPPLELEEIMHPISSGIPRHGLLPAPRDA